MNPDTLEQVRTQMYEAMGLPGFQNLIDDSTPLQAVLTHGTNFHTGINNTSTRRDLDTLFDETLKEYGDKWNVSQVKVQEKKVFTLFQILTKLDLFIAEVKSIEDVKVVVGGSLGLLLQGYVLDRPIGDLDILIECKDRDRINKYLQSKYPILRSSNSNDFQLAIGFGNTYERIKIDICFATKVNHVVTTYNGKTYLANDYKNILRYKIAYAAHNDKHFDDIIKLIDKQPIKKVKFTTNV